MNVNTATHSLRASSPFGGVARVARERRRDWEGDLPRINFPLKQIPSKTTKVKDKRNQFDFIALKWAPVEG